MKRKVLAMLVPALLVAGAANAAEVYNKNGNKLELYGKSSWSALLLTDRELVKKAIMRKIPLMPVSVSKVKHRSALTSSLVTVSGNTTCKQMAQKAMEITLLPVWHIAGLGFGQNGTFDYGRNYGVVYDIEAWTDMLPEFGGDTYAGADNFMNGRTNGVATYRNNDFFGHG